MKFGLKRTLVVAFALVGVGASLGLNHGGGPRLLITRDNVPCLFSQIIHIIARKPITNINIIYINYFYFFKKYTYTI